MEDVSGEVVRVKMEDVKVLGGSMCRERERVREREREKEGEVKSIYAQYGVG